MATLKINRIWGIGIGSPHVKTDWQVSKSTDFRPENLVFNVMGDTENLYIKKGILRNPDGTLYDPYLGSYARARVWYGTTPSAWFNINNTPCIKSGIVVDEDNMDDGIRHIQYLSTGKVVTYRTEERYIIDNTIVFPNNYTPDII